MVTVVLQSGICVPRQFAHFVSAAYGQDVNTFFDKLVRREYATVCGCLHNRARLYHVHHQALCRAVGEPENRHRRPVPARQAIERLMLLHGVITNPELIWLATEPDKVSFFSLMAPSLPVERLPHSTSGEGPSACVRLFPEKRPIGSSQTVVWCSCTWSRHR
jgi:hypothetical protein